MKNSSHVSALQFALTFIFICVIVYGYDQWMGYHHLGREVDSISVLSDGVLGLAILGAIATAAFFAGSFASQFRLKSSISTAAAVASAMSYWATEDATQHTGRALILMSAVAFLVPFLASKVVRNAA